MVWLVIWLVMRWGCTYICFRPVLASGVLLYASPNASLSYISSCCSCCCAVVAVVVIAVVDIDAAIVAVGTVFVDLSSLSSAFRGLPLFLAAPAQAHKAKIVLNASLQSPFRPPVESVTRILNGYASTVDFALDTVSQQASSDGGTGVIMSRFYLLLKPLESRTDVVGDKLIEICVRSFPTGRRVMTRSLLRKLPPSESK